MNANKLPVTNIRNIFDEPAVYQLLYQKPSHCKLKDVHIVDKCMQFVDMIALKTPWLKGRYGDWMDLGLPLLDEYRILEGFSYKSEHKRFLDDFSFLAERTESWREMDLNGGTGGRGNVVIDDFPAGTNVFLALYYSIACIPNLTDMFKNVYRNLDNAGGGYAVIHLGYYGEDRLESNHDMMQTESMQTLLVDANDESVWDYFAHGYEPKFGDLAIQDTCSHTYDHSNCKLFTSHHLVSKYQGRALAEYNVESEWNYKSYDFILHCAIDAGFSISASFGKAGFIPVVNDGQSDCKAYPLEMQKPMRRHPTELILWVRPSGV